MPATVEALCALFVSLAEIPSPTGSERAVADAVSAYLREAGLEVVEDDTAAVTGCGSGNLIARIPGRGTGTPVALCAHLDTVPVTGAPEVVVDDGVVRSGGDTILGADDKAAIAVLLLLARDLVAEPPAASVELVFTTGEEAGLRGAKAIDLSALEAGVIFVLDSEGAPGTVIAGAPTMKAVDAEFRGVAAHSGIEPENGRSAIVAAARAVAAMTLGRIDEQTTANVGLLNGGNAVNIVPDNCRLRAEARSHDAAKLARQVGQMVEAVTTAAAATGVDVSVDVSEHYHGYAHDRAGLPIRLVAEAAASAGLEAQLITGGGGSDANVFNLRGVPAVTLGVGFENVHTPRESMSLAHLEQLYALMHALVRVAGTAAASRP